MLPQMDKMYSNLRYDIICILVVLDYLEIGWLAWLLASFLGLL